MLLAQPSQSVPPNIVFLLTTDQRWDALGYAGHPIIHIHEIDRLRQQGLYLSLHQYVLPAGPVSLQDCMRVAMAIPC
ncbi:hypothetical protein PZB74_03905 [Porifericola rhodea]|uniref:hypothetical protein n=1 Tax=Porifericola rhodea TaxID=930972 RepID=UPI0026650169|nr:hypothetical protein [Porifericola rhodea]WKN32491.1 hypothetical protein PZB74_03905 [Porifericola rhodea]